MSRTEQSVRLLQAVAAIAGLAVLLWSLGLPNLRFADAANLTSISDTLSDSAPNVVSNHDIAFTIPADGTNLGGTDTITIAFPASSFDLSNLGLSDFDFATATDYTLELGTSPGAGNVGVSTTTTDIVFTLGAGVSIATGTAISVEVGTNATFGATGVNQIVNPASNTYEINISTSQGDSGATRVVILDNVLLTASVDTNFDFVINGVGSNQLVNGTTTTGTTTATAIPFGTLEAGISSTTAHDISVSTNAKDGFVVTVSVDGTLTSASGATIDGFVNGSDTNIPTNWTAPTGLLGSNNTYGHWGITSDDATTTRASEFGSDQWIAASTTPRVIMSHNSSANGELTGIGIARVGFRVEITALQEAADDYDAILTYVATPTF